MDKAALQALTRAGLQELAKFNGVKANSTTAQIIKDLLAIKQPLQFPCPANPSITSGPGRASEDRKQTLRRSRRVRAPRAAVVNSSAEEIDMGLGPNIFSYRGDAQSSFRSQNLAAEDQWADGLDDDDESNASDASSDFQGPASPWKAGKVFADADGDGNGPSFLLRPVREWQPSRDNAGAVEDATGNDARLQSPGLAAPSTSAVYRPGFLDLRATLARIAPLAEDDAKAKQSIRELGALVNVAEGKAAEVKMKARQLCQLRRALETEFFAKVKTDPRLLNGTWTKETTSSEEQQTNTQAVETTLGKSSEGEALRSDAVQPTCEEEEPRFDTIAKGKRRARDVDEDSSPARRVRRRESYEA
ncbi:hypothetical protein C2E23DRAFT_857580 [Lenzites betulinus]|nr:hypothetical protein C2E23DRAFT_857580 [Lenzites betulinus]